MFVCILLLNHCYSFNHTHTHTNKQHINKHASNKKGKQHKLHYKHPFFQQPTIFLLSTYSPKKTQNIKKLQKHTHTQAKQKNTPKKQKITAITQQINKKAKKKKERKDYKTSESDESSSSSPVPPRRLFNN